MKRKILLLIVSCVISSLSFGQIFITEIADPLDNTGGRYVELFNYGDSDVDLSTGYGLQRYTNGNAEPQTTIYALTGTIPAKGYYIVVKSASGFESIYGFAPDQEIGDAGPADSNGDDQIQLLDPSSTVIDIFGVPGEDGTGTCHGFEDGRAERVASVTTGNAGTWSEANWNVWGLTESLACTNHITSSVSTTDGLFDPGQWIGYVPTNTILNFESLTSSISEDGVSIDICVSIENPDATNNTTVDINMDALSSAENGSDFASITFPYTLTFPAGSSDNQCLTVNITDDSEVELPDTLILVLENPLGGSSSELGTQTQYSLIIEDNDLVCPGTGSVIFTEVMQNPTAANDPLGEWFEVHNTTDADIDLFGMNFMDDATASEFFYIEKSLVIPAGGYMVFAYSDNIDENGGFQADYRYPDYMTMANSTDGIILQCLGTGLDSVTWDNGATFPDPAGASMVLLPGFENYIDNNYGVNWDTCEFVYGAGDKGTPGCANEAPCCDLVLGIQETFCDDRTEGNDTYTIIIPFSGGGTSTFAIVASAGTVGGDDPSLVATGDIMITGVQEGTDVTLTVDNINVGGACNFILEIRSPYCYIPTCADAGSIIVTEVMQNPSKVSDEDGEWFELYNTTDNDIDIHGWNIVDDYYIEHGKLEIAAVEHSLIVPAHGYVLFAVNDTATVNGGLPTPDYVYDYGYPTLANATDGLTVRCENTIIDSIQWDNGATFPDPNGASMALSPDFLDAINNDNGANWFTSDTYAYGDGDLGTPGYANDGPSCGIVLDVPVASCETETSGTDTYSVSISFSNAGFFGYSVTAATGTVGGDDPALLTEGTIVVSGIQEGAEASITVQNTLIADACTHTINVESPFCFSATCADAGSIIITEIMQNPSAVSDDLGEWFEIHNTTANTIDLQGWFVMDNDMSFNDEGFTILNSLEVAAGGYAILANNIDAASNGGLPTPAYVFDPENYLLGNGSDGIVLQCGDNVIDSVVWDGGTTFPDPTGASMTLSNDYLNATDNNNGANWASSTKAYGDGDFGTPGEVNENVSVNTRKMIQFSIYPNPVTDGYFTVRFESNANRTVSIYDMTGKLVQDMNFVDNEKVINTSLNTGIYIMKVTEDGKQSSHKLVIQ